MNIHRRLGRGLGGLIQSTVGADPTPAEVRTASDLAIQDIRPNPYQPRQVFDDAALQDLKASIAEHGLLQPIVVRRAAGGYEVIAGERRLRACRSLGLERIAVVVRDVDDASMQTLALVENLQREDLNPLEKARALRAMMLTQGLTQDVVAARVGKDRATIANLVRLLELPEDVKSWIEGGQLTGGHARALLQVAGDAKRSHLAKLAVERGLSVRDVERFARLTPGARRRGTPGTKDPFVADLEERLRRTLEAKVQVTRKGSGGRIQIEYRDAQDLDRLLGRLGI